MPPQPRDAFDTPQLVRAVDQLRRIDDVRRALLMDEDPDLRVLLDEQARRARVIEVDVRDEESTRCR